ncbi:lantibiotic ABC transporter,ATP-binding protein, partial [human gut metagenome]
KQYGAQTSVSDLSIHVRQGRIYGLLGRNGAGKTTTMRMLLGLTDPSSGTVSLFGKPLRGNEKKILPRIGSLIESPGFYPNLTGTENLRIFADLRGLKSPKYIKSALEVVNLPYRDKKLFSQYSLGMKQRLAIALAIMHNPELLILDEPINGLDPIGIAEVRDFIRELCDATGKTILISSHILSEIALLADDVGIIDHGVLVEEESLEELEAKNGKYFRFTVSNAAAAGRLLYERLGIHDMTVDSANELTVRDLHLDTAQAISLFVGAGLTVSDAHLYEDTLEDYFKKVTGGEGIA